MKTINQAWTLAQTPKEGWPSADDFALVENKLPKVGPNQALTRTIYLSLDPYQWGRRRNGVEHPGEICHGRTVSEIVESRMTNYRPGDLVFNTNGWQKFGLIGEGVDVFGYMHPRKLNPSDAPITTALGVLGMLGLTAYAGLSIQCQPVSGETVIVSAASGGVGQVAGQIAKINGCHVVGVAGRQEKCDFVVNELGFDQCVSHLSENYERDIQKACPHGADIYFENVGGKTYQGVLPLLNPNSRITVCGMISQYGNTDGLDTRELWNQIGQSTFDRQATTIHSLFVGNFVSSHQQEFLSKMSSWIKQDQIKYREHIWNGLAKAPEAFIAMLSGNNFGKTLVKIREDPTI